MNNFENLADTDLLDLDEEGIQRWIDITCAQKGLPLLPPKPGSKPEVLAVSKSNIAIHIKMPYDTYYPLSGRKEVEKAIAILNSLPLLTSAYVGKGYSGPKYLKSSDDSVSYKQPAFHTKEEARKALDIQEDSQHEFDLHAAATKAYDDAVDLRHDTVEYVRSKVQLANDRYAAYLALSKSWDQYLDLADGDEGIADRFFINRHGEESHRKVRPNYYMAEEQTKEEK